MAADVVVSLPMGARLWVFAGLRLTGVPTASSTAAASEVARTISAWTGPGAVVMAGDLFDGCEDGPADVAAALEAHAELAQAFRDFSAGAGRRVVVLPGTRDAWLSWWLPAIETVRSLAGAEVAPSVVAELGTAAGLRSLRVEPGSEWGPQPRHWSPAGAGAPPATSATTPAGAARNEHGAPPARRHRLADVVPGLWRGSTSNWLADLGRLDDPSATARATASRFAYRQVARRAWLLTVPVLLAVLVRLPIALLGPARHLASLVLATALVASFVEMVVLAGLAIAFVRPVWLAVSGRGTGPIDLNERGRARAVELVGQGFAGLVTASTCRPELSRTAGGFYANAGCCAEVVSQQVPRRGFGALPSAFIGCRQLAWVEVETGHEIHVRLLYGNQALPGTTVLERLVARPSSPGRGWRHGPPGRLGRLGRLVCLGGHQAPPSPVPSVVASFPGGGSWPLHVVSQVPHRRARRMAAFVVAAAGFVSLLAALSPPARPHLHLLRSFLPMVVPQAAGALAALGGIALLMLARGIRRGLRRAYLVCEAILLTVAVLHLARPGGLPAAAVAFLVAAYLWWRRGSFRAAGDQRNLGWGLARLVGLAATALAAGTLALEGTSWASIHLHHLRTHRIGWSTAAVATAERMVGIGDIALPDRLADFFTPAMVSVTAGLVLYAAWLAFRPVVAGHQEGAALAMDRARAIVSRHGSGTLDYFALRSDKDLYFWGDTLVGYAVYGGVCLVSPDPIGPPSEREAAWKSFRDYADSNGWSLAVMAASEDWLPVYRSHGMHDLYVGDEAVVRVDQFHLGGGRHKGLRQAVNRVARHGYTVSFHDPATVAPELAAELEVVMTRSRRGGVERGFSMTLGRMFDPRDTGLLLAVVHGPAPAGPGAGDPAPAPGPGLGPPGLAPQPPAGPAVAFCQYVPAPGIKGYSLDLMRRDNGEHPNGLIDFAIVKTIGHLAERGYEGLDLNFATMRAVLAGEAGDGLAPRVQAWLLRRMSGPMQIESLWKFNAKFDPEWLPRYAVFDSVENALPAALAVAKAESFWELPLIGRFLVPSAQRQEEAAGGGART